ncbi:zinc-binding dehydrogenase [Dactylosporangium sp. NPDC005572]|uniref:zinc-binding dehydrogenase n=1 Tax=Dactylosporangium sp. NPDC005572 TaxID=3156889 RepID=UPI0033A67256
MTSIPSTCRAAALVEGGKPLEIVDVVVPAELEPGAILVEVTTATVCATDVHIASGKLAGGVTLPIIPGHEMTGRVARLGPGVDRDSVGQPLTVGDRIVWTHGFCGRCYNCVIAHEPTLCTDRRAYMATPYQQYPYLTGGFSEYCYVFPTSGRVKVPDAIPDAVASASSCALRTVMHGFARLGPVEDRTVVVQGAGPLGLFAVARAVASNAAKVIVVGAPAERLALAKSWGAAEVLDVGEVPDADERVARVRDIVDGADVVIEMSGAPSAFTEGMQMLGRNGRYLLIGQVRANLAEFDASQIVHKQATLIGSLSGSVEDYWAALRFLQAHRDRFDWNAMISNHYRFEDINNALDAMRNLTEIKPAIVFTAPGSR